MFTWSFMLWSRFSCISGNCVFYNIGNSGFLFIKMWTWNHRIAGLDFFIYPWRFEKKTRNALMVYSFIPKATKDSKWNTVLRSGTVGWAISPSEGTRQGGTTSQPSGFFGKSFWTCNPCLAELSETELQSLTRSVKSSVLTFEKQQQSWITESPAKVPDGHLLAEQAAIGKRQGNPPRMAVGCPGIAPQTIWVNLEKISGPHSKTPSQFSVSGRWSVKIHRKWWYFHSRGHTNDWGVIQCHVSDSRAWTTCKWMNGWRIQRRRSVAGSLWNPPRRLLKPGCLNWKTTRLFLDNDLKRLF